MGFPVFTWFSMGLFFIAVLSSAKTVFSAAYKRKVKDDELIILLLFFSLLLGIISSLIHGWAFTKSITNIGTFYMPFFVCALIYKTKISFKQIITCSSIGIIIAAFISLLIAFGLLSSGVHTGVIATDSIAFNYNYVDGTSGVFGMILGVYLFLDKDNGEKVKGIVCIVSGLIIVVFAQSRGLTLAFIFALVFELFTMIHYSSGGEGIKKMLRVMFVIFAIILIVITTNNPVKDYILRINERLIATNINEGNISYRFNEISEYFDLFKENPFIGRGWGLINNETGSSLYTTRYRAHNMYFGILACSGLSYTPIFCLILFIMLKRNIKRIHAERSLKFAFSATCIIAVALLGIANAGFDNAFCITFTIVSFAVIKDYHLQTKGQFF